MRLVLLTGALLLVAGIAADVSRASTVDIASPPGGETLRYVAAPGERNDLTFTPIEDSSPPAFMVSDPGATVGVGPGCVSVDLHRAVCVSTSPSLYHMRVVLGDADDVLHPAGFNLVNADGGAGNDRLLGGTWDDRLDGGSGMDDVRGNEGADVLLDGDRDDGPTATVDADVLDGGPGADWVSYEGRTKALTIDLSDRDADGAAGEGDVLIGIESIHSGRGADHLTGDDRPNRFDDEGGHNEFFGKGGDDSFESTHEGTIDCGRGDDLVRGVNRRVSVSANCETLLRYVGDGEFRLRPYPRTNDGAMFLDMGCGGDVDGEPIPCSGTVTLTTASRPRRTLARGAFRPGVGRRSARLSLTDAGRRLLRRQAVAVIVQLRGSGTPDMEWGIALGPIG